MSFLRKIFNSAVGFNPFEENVLAVPPTADRMSPGVTPWGTSWTGHGTDAGAFNTRRLQDILPAERRYTIARSRFIRNRTGLGKAMIEGCARYSIGEGLWGYSATGDDQYDAACNRFCDDWLASEDDQRNIELSGEHSFLSIQSVIAMAMMTDGDVGAYKVLRRDMSGKPVDMPKLQLFATDQITDNLTGGWDVFGTGYGWREGILRDEFGRKLKFRVHVELAPGYPIAPGYVPSMFAEVDARDMIHVLDPNRIGIGRGIPWTTHGQDSSVAMMDLTQLEKAAAYLNSFFGAVITTPTGEIPEGFEAEVFRSRRRSSEGEGEQGKKKRADQLYRKYANFLNGALIPVLKEGERIEMVKNDRPSVTFTGFMDWLVNDIACGFGVPPSFVWAAAGRTGPETRQTLAQADWFFKHIMMRMRQRFCKPARDFYIRWGLVTGKFNDGKLPRNGASPFLARWHGPRKITIDERYFYKTWLDRLAQGLGTEEEFYADLGLEAADVRRARVLEVKDWLRLCEENGVPYDLVKQAMPGQMNAATARAPQNAPIA